MGTRAYVDELRLRAERFAKEHPDLIVRWRQEELVFPKAAQDGFDVIVRPCTYGFGVLTDVGEIRQEIDSDPSEAAEEALELVRQMLGPHTRIRERCAGRQGYWWTLESLYRGRWTPVVQTGVLFWNYFAARSSRIYQNHTLPGREAAEQANAADEAQGGTRTGG